MAKAARPTKPDRAGAPRAPDPLRVDVENWYQLFLAREPESEAAYTAYGGRDPVDLLLTLAGSAEFNARVIDALERGENPWRAEGPPSPELIRWIARTLPLSPAGARAVRNAGESWAKLFRVLATDARFRDALGDSRLIQQAAVQTLRSHSVAVGQVERVDASVVSGWAGPLEADGAPLTVELWIDGAFVASMKADRFRRDIQDRLGGEGLRGFSFTLPRPLPALGEMAAISVTAGAERVRIGAFDVPVGRSNPAVIDAYREEIRSLKAMVERLEQALPVALQAQGGSLADWDGYYQTWCAGLSAERSGAERWTVVIDADAAPPALVQASVASVVDHAIAGDQVLLTASKGSEPFARDLALRARSMGPARVAVVQTEARDQGDRAAAAIAHVGASDFVLLMEPGAVVAPAALALLAEAFVDNGSVRAIYVDDDAFDPASPPETPCRTHCDPRLKPAYDPDLLLQTPYVGATLAFRTQALVGAGLKAGCGRLYGVDAVLRLADAPGAIGHLARILATRAAPSAEGDAEESDDWARCVVAYLAATEPSAIVEPHRDVLGAAAPGAVRVRRPVARQTASVIIPTRDGLELLRPCIESLVAREIDNLTRLQVIVVDHESREPAMKTYLEELSDGGRASILPFEGDFNWALMNNLAAARSDADVLVFLNNDTVAISPDWLDELVGQAMRPEVGIVGVRMIYGDGALQHGGFVSRGDGRHALIHDGVGEPGQDGGYLARYALLRRSPMVTGACLAIRRELFERLGGFDAANFPVEGNDADLCFRARAAGLRILYDPYATLYHLESKSRGFNLSPEKQARADAAMELLQRRWPDQYGADPGFNSHFDRTGRPFTRLRPPPGKISLA